MSPGISAGSLHAVGLFEERAATGEIVHVRRLGELVAVATEVRLQVIDGDKEDVRFSGCRRGQAESDGHEGQGS